MEIINAVINTMSGDVISNGYIRTGGSKISAVGDMKAYHRADDEIIDLKGAAVYPGFIDAHTHLGMWEDALGFEGDDGNEDTDPILPNLRAIDAANPRDKCFRETLESGITTVITGPGSSNPIAGQMAAIKLDGRCIDDMIIKAPVAMKMAFGENPKSVYNDKGRAPTTRMATAALIREELSKAIRYAEDMEKSVSQGEDRPDYDAKLEALLPVIKGDLPVHFHAHRADDIFTAIRIAKEFKLEYAIVHATEAGEIVQELKSEGAKLMVGPILTDRNKPELVRMDISTAGKVANGGVMSAIITDHPVVPAQYLLVCAALAVRGGMTKEDAMKAITINPARICSLEKQIGSIEVGKDADIVVFKDDPLLISSEAALVIINGKVKHENGNFV